MTFIGNRRELNFVQQVFFLLSTEGSFEITRAYPALCLGGTPSQETGTRPPSCLFLKKRLFMNDSLLGSEDCFGNLRATELTLIRPIE